MERAIFSLGSNCEPRLDYLDRAVRALEADPAIALTGVTCSAIYRSEALLPPDAPIDWNRPYYNQVISGMVGIGPERLLERIKAIEAEIGRVDRGWWAPREIDIDILALGDRRVDLPHLTIPHSQMLKRDFVMRPLAELFPEWRHPDDASRHTARDYAASFAHRGGASPLGPGEAAGA